MIPFRAPVGDILWSLAHVAGGASLPGWDGEMLGEIAGHYAAFMEGEIAPLNAPGDAEGCTLEAGRVTMPAGHREAYQAYAEAGWPSLTLPEEHGGQGLDALYLAVTSEIFSGAHHSMQMVTGLVPGLARVLLKFGTEDQQARILPELASGGALATMCLTESGAGSDLSRIRCRAEKSGEGYAITGEKIFISGGDQDLTDQIQHLVLARTSDDGLRGLSLFLAPAVLPSGARNGISVTRIEEKMGLHASPTCQMAFDGARGEIIGAEGQGLAAMFAMMNHARADVALQGVAHAARARDIAATYAAERTQGRRADGAPAVLADHADVARMLEEMDGFALAGRAVAHLACVAMEGGGQGDLVEFLTPLAKVYCTEGGMRAAELGAQVLGGYGYLTEYGLDQTYRDARITAIYEGANGIHERALVSRLLGAAPGAAFEGFLASEEGAAEALALWQAGRVVALGAKDPLPLAHDMMALSIHALCAALWHRMLAAAPAHEDPARITAAARRALADSAAFAPAHLARMRAAAA